MFKLFSKTLFVFSIVLFFSLCFIFYYESEIERSFVICFIELFFLSIVFILEKINIKIKGHPFHILFKIFRFFASLSLILIIFLITYLIYAFSCRVPFINYSKTLKELVSEEYSYQIKHFPLVIPKGAKNYYFCYDDCWQDGGVHFLRFNISTEYLDEIINKNQQDISNVMNYSEFYQNYYQSLLELGIEKRRKSMSEDEFKQSEKEYTVYILKNEHNDNSYTSGFIVSKKYKEIIYFFYHN